MSPNRVGDHRFERPIAEHGLIGDLRSAALVATDGTIDWFCPRRFDAPSVFAAILDDAAGHWKMAPTCDVVSRTQFYFPESAVLVTRFLTEQGIVECQDFMPILRPHDPDHRQRLVRRVVNVRGTIGMRTEIEPRPDYARKRDTVKAVPGGVLFTDGDLAMTLGSGVDLETDAQGAHAEFSLDEGESALFVLEMHNDGDALPEDLRPADVDTLFDATVAFWQQWLKTSTYTGRWRETVHRSAITLKLLTHEPTGAIVAAPTMALPEHLGGERNWDYRYVWLRDAAFVLYALLRLGFTAEAGAFINWLTDRFADAKDVCGEGGPLRVMYTIDGDQPPAEKELEHLAGYANSKPVLVGNGAADQLQLDVYGELIDSIYLYDKYGKGISHGDWANLCVVLDWLSEHWDQPDEGIWETRGGRTDHTFSRLMSWVAFERMIRMTRRRGLPGDITGWTTTRDAIYHQIMDQGYDTKREAFVQRYGADTLDASILLMPMVKFVGPTEPRFLSTLDAIAEDLVVDTLVFRYDVEDSPDGLDGDEGTFSMCSYWYIEALTRAGRLDEARIALEKMFTYANHLGLYAEEIGMTGDQLGNFPQAFTHLSLISAAINLDRALG